MELLLGVVAVAVAVAVVAFIGRWILGPIDEAARVRWRPVQFTLVDFFCLIFLFQLPLAVVQAYLPEQEPARWAMLGFGLVAVTAMWATSVGSLSRAGIASVWRRGLFLSLVLPLTYFGSIVWVVIWVVLAFAVFDFWYHRTNVPIVLLLAVNLALTAAFFAAARFTRTMARQSDVAPTFEDVLAD